MDRPPPPPRPQLRYYPPTTGWQRRLGAALGDPLQLPRVTPAMAAAAQLFPLRIPARWRPRLERPGAAHDPLLRQVLPDAAELAPAPGFVSDPLQEERALAAPGLVRKYAGRALLLVSSACPVHCRYCFRRHTPAGRAPAAWEGFAPALAHLAADPTLSEVILSGGDPLMRDDPFLQRLITALAAMPHLHRLRIHTRMPVVAPERITLPLLAALTGSRLRPVVVIHANHPEELDGTVAAALERLSAWGVALYNQAVLLRGVNDRVETLAELSQRLLDLRVQPYYLHLLDPVAGAAHFQVGEAEARGLLAALRQRLPGYAIPALVQERPGHPAKVPLPPGVA